MTPDANLQAAAGPLWLFPSLAPLLAEPSGSPGQSQWWRHAPFAGWLLASAPPRRAAGEGEAFRALQELATRAGLATEWHGAGGGEPLDLLLLDGRWTEAEAPTVMARWKPLLAAGAVVLVHGTNPGEGGSLLWRDWSQGASPLSRFEFADGAGLGMLLSDEARAPGILRRLCALPPAVAADFKSLCAALGARWTGCQRDAVAAMAAAESARSLDAARRRNEALRRRLELQEEKLDATLVAERASRDEERARILAEMSAAARAHAGEIVQLTARADAVAQEMALAHAAETGRLTARADATAQKMALAHAAETERLLTRAGAAAQEMALAHAAEIDLARAAAAEEIARLSRRSQAAAHEASLAHAERIARLSARADAAERAMVLVMASTSWRAARVIAGVAGRLPLPMRIAGRRAACVAWWAVTGQLPERVRRRRRARRTLPLLRNSPLFDPVWYATTYPDVALSGIDPALHFAVYGASEYRKPGPGFDTEWYRMRYPDVAAAGIHPLLHFIEYGAEEGREWRAVAPVPVSSAPEDRSEDARPESAAPPLVPDAGAEDVAPLPPEPAAPLLVADAGAEDAAPLPPEPAAPLLVPDAGAEDAAPFPPEPAAPPSVPDAGVEDAAPLPAEPAAPAPGPFVEAGAGRPAAADPAAGPSLLEGLGAPEEDAPRAAALSEAEQGPWPDAPQRELLGRDLPAITIFPVTVGFVTRSTPIALLRRAVEAAQTALDGIGQVKSGSILVCDDGAMADPSGLLPWTVSCFPPVGAPGFAAAHNRLMEAAFAAGAEVYIAAHPAGVLHLDALIGLLRMVRMSFRRALVEATRSPVPVPRPVDARSYSVPWSCGACLAIPRQIYEAVGGFDEKLDSWGADVDLSWRAKAAGFAALICPDALLELPFREGADDGIPAAVLASAVGLARKWGLASAEAEFTGLLVAANESLPDMPVAALPETQRAIADFGARPFFGDEIW